MVKRGLINRNTCKLASLLKVIIFFFAVLYPGISLAQRNCGTVEYNKIILNQRPESIDQFERWIKEKIEGKQFISDYPYAIFALKESLVKIPVVIHVIHNGEPIGVGTNISDAQIISQIDVLNEDFRRLNADTSETQDIFKPVAADVEIEFMLAKQDPEGLPTTGIVRVKGSETSWNFDNDTKLKGESYWPAEDYLNIWVTTLSFNLLGFASFPIANLEGLEDQETNRLLDGVVIGFDYFGSIEKYPDANLDPVFNLGRTTTHEIGHFLGLRHISGDVGGCSVDDFVTDTPNQDNQNEGCPVTVPGICESVDFEMFQNYLDYTDDACMNIFSMGQKERMRIVVESSPRRTSLTTSHALEDPVISAFDLGIREIISPVSGICTPFFSPAISIRNYGSELITQATVELWINDSMIESRVEMLSLTSLQSYIVTFNTTPVPPAGLAEIEFRIISVNGKTDDNPINDVEMNEVFVSEFIDLPVNEEFNATPVAWEIRNRDNASTWELAQSASWQPDNRAMQLAFRNDPNIGEIEMMIMPIIDLTGISEAYLQFDMAYAYTPGADNDRLQVVISKDCGTNFNFVLYDRSGAGLSTTDDSKFSFTPSDRRDWKREVINLSLFLGEPSLQVAFIGTNGNGNNIYIDNVAIYVNAIMDAGIKGIESPYLAFCAESIAPIITVENLGTKEINEVLLSYELSGQITGTKTFSSLELKSGNSINLILDDMNVNNGVSLLTVEVSLPGTIDPSPENNRMAFSLVNDCQEEAVPFRQNFDVDILSETNWLSINPFDDIAWKVTKTGTDGNSAGIENFKYKNAGLKDFLVSPVINMTSLFKASVFFDVSYASDTLPGEYLRVLASSDDGLTYPHLLYEKSGDQIAVNTPNTPWTPGSDQDWVHEFIDLSDFAGEKIRLAFEVTGNRSNNLFIDDIEFFSDNNPEPVRIEDNMVLYPNPASGANFNITFNLHEKENIIIFIFDSMGKEIYRRTYPNTLNQTYLFDLTGNQAGMYILKTTGATLNTSLRIFIDP